MIFCSPLPCARQSTEMPKRNAAKFWIRSRQCRPVHCVWSFQLVTGWSWFPFFSFVDACGAASFDLLDTLPQLKQLLSDAQMAEQAIKRNPAQLEERCTALIWERKFLESNNASPLCQPPVGPFARCTPAPPYEAVVPPSALAPSSTPWRALRLTPGRRVGRRGRPGCGHQQ